MCWIKGRWSQIVVLTAMVALLDGQAAAAAGSPVRRGAWYHASGRQSHYPNGAFSLQFLVSGNGRRVTMLSIAGGGVSVPCAHGHAGRLDLTTMPSVASAPINKNGSFRAGVKIPIQNAAGTIVTIAGRFVSGGRARGTLRYRGKGMFKGCNADGTWTGRAWPLLPPVQRFVGRTDQGTVVTFERTIETHPRVTLLDFGPLTGTTDLANGASCTPGDPVATRGLAPPWYAFGLPVFGHGDFSGTSYGGASRLDISGHFATNSRASGTISYDDEGDCAIDASWTAHLTH